MSRLRYSKKGYLRSLQMSHNKLFAFVEGKESDPYFFGKLCEVICGPANVAYQVRMARELPVNSGGKPTLIEFYRFLKSSSSLISRFGLKKTAVIFFLDKDIDDFLHRKCRSEHVVYTEYYDVQNHIFRASNFHEGLASAACVDPSIIREHPTFAGDWCHRAANRWKEWAKLCVFAQKYKVNSICNYHSTSQINQPLNGIVAPIKRENLVSELSKAFSGTTLQFAQALSVVSDYVDRLFVKGLQDRVFKGKWYATLAELDMRAAFKGRPFSFDGVAKRLSSSLSITLDFSASWALPFRSAIIQIVDKILNFRD